MVTLEKVPFIEATEPEVVELHRSLAPVSMSVEGPAPLAVQAFACVLKREAGYSVYAALHCKEIKRTLIYAVGSPTEGVQAYRQLLGKALEFTKKVGCQMEAMNLKYSSAMRGVILRDVPVLAPPGSGRKSLLDRASAKAELEQLIAENQVAGAPQEDESTLSPEKRMERRHARDAQAAKAEAAGRRLAAEKRIDELEETWGEAVAPIVDAINGVLTPAASHQTSRNKPDKRVGELEEKVHRLEDELAAERSAREKLQLEKGAAEKRIAELEQRVQRAEEQAKTSGEAAKKGDVADKISRRVGELEEMLRLAKSEAEAERAEKERLQQAERRLNAAGSAKKGGNDDDRVAELEQALQQAEGRAEFLRHEVERLAAAKVMAEKQASEVAATAPAKSRAALTAPETKLPPLSPRVESGPDPRTVRRPPPPGSFFRVDWDLTAIPCGSVKEICEVHRSTGMVRLSLEGYPNQYCSAFILVVKSGERKQVFMPFRLSANSQLLIYVPAKQPDSPAAFAKAMMEAGKFLQVVGMDIESLPVEKTGKLPPEIETLFSIGTPSGA